VSSSDLSSESQDGDKPEVVGGPAMAVGLVVIVILLGVVVLGAVFTFPTHGTPSQGGFVNDVFASKPTLWAARLLVLAAVAVAAVGGIYVVTSIVQWMQTGYPLQQLGPFRVSEKNAREIQRQIDSDVERLEGLLEEANSANSELAARLRASEQEYEDLLKELAQIVRTDDDDDDNTIVGPDRQ
jgi:hypothetical protein